MGSDDPAAKAAGEGAVGGVKLGGAHGGGGDLRSMTPPEADAAL